MHLLIYSWYILFLSNYNVTGTVAYAGYIDFLWNCHDTMTDSKNSRLNFRWNSWGILWKKIVIFFHELSLNLQISSRKIHKKSISSAPSVYFNIKLENLETSIAQSANCFCLWQYLFRIVRTLLSSSINNFIITINKLCRGQSNGQSYIILLHGFQRKIKSLSWSLHLLFEKIAKILNVYICIYFFLIQSVSNSWIL